MNAYVSGHCSAGVHDRCRGLYAGVTCTCECRHRPADRSLRIGSLFSGYEGLGMAVQSVLGGDIAWVSDIDPGACKILAHRYPDVPNLGDITAVDWSAVEPVDVLVGGFPCQDLSMAGRRKGMRPGTRSGLWADFKTAIDELRPSLVVIENVRGLLSGCAETDAGACPACAADDDMEPDEGRVGDGKHRPVLRALGRVLGDLANIGYDASWQGLRAADVGAPHARFRVFVVAWPADSDGPRLEGGWAGGHGSEQSEPFRPAAPSSDRQDDGWKRARRARYGRSGPADCGDGSATDADRDRREGQSGSPTGRDTLRAAERDDPDRRGDLVVANPSGDSRRLGIGDCGLAADPDGHAVRLESVGESGRCSAPVTGHSGVEWGVYEPAIRRWERLTRPAPLPFMANKNGDPQLAPAFAEWMQGLPAGWVTDVPGLTRNEQLKALGNGVVWQQAAQALRMLLPEVGRAAA